MSDSILEAREVLEAAQGLGMYDRAAAGDVSVGGWRPAGHALLTPLDLAAFVVDPVLLVVLPQVSFNPLGHVVSCGSVFGEVFDHGCRRVERPLFAEAASAAFDRSAKGLPLAILELAADSISRRTTNQDRLPDIAGVHLVKPASSHK